MTTTDSTLETEHTIHWRLEWRENEIDQWALVGTYDRIEPAKRAFRSQLEGAMRLVEVRSHYVVIGEVRV